MISVPTLARITCKQVVGLAAARGSRFAMERFVGKITVGHGSC